MFRKMIGWLVAVIVVVAVVLISIPSFIADSIYKNVDDVSGDGMPATVTAFQSGPDVVSTIGGSGEGLNCSLPSWTNIFFADEKDVQGKRHLLLQTFRQACVFHDLCYRHGLATYGYTQNDCDRILQNAAFRVCLFIRGQEHGPANCQKDSKLVLAGVSIGGYDAYRGWDRSTYFEFDSDPSRSNGFIVSRVVAHPFKAIDPDKYRDDANEVILTFENVRSNLTVRCATCANVSILKSTRDPNEVSAEFRSVGVVKLPEDLLMRQEQFLSERNPVWLPPRRRHAAPHLLVDDASKNHLIWISRNNRQDTISCVVLADAAKLLTNTLAKRDFCSAESSSALTMTEFDMFSPSPLPMEIPGAHDRIFATAITIEKTVDLSLSFCSRSASRAVDYESKGFDDQAKCRTFIDAEVTKRAAIGAFQNFPVIRRGQQIFFARDLAQREDSFLSGVWQRIVGDTYSPRGTLLVIDVYPPATPQGPAYAKLNRVIRFDIDDRFDPMMPMTREANDLRFLSIEAAEMRARLHIIDFDKAVPAVENVRLSMHDRDVELHGSWASRPMLVLETREPQPRTKLVLSRGEILSEQDERFDPARVSEAVQLETLVFERDAAAPADAPFLKAGGASCKITYTFRSFPEYQCYRRFNPTRTMRPSPAAMMRAGQLLVGHFAGADGHGIAFPDSCLPSEPIILRPEGTTFTPLKNSAGGPSLRREISCKPLDTAAVSGPTGRGSTEQSVD